MKALTPQSTSVGYRDAELTRSSSLISAGFEQTRRRWRDRFKRAPGLVRAFWRNVKGVMREIADENAYERHLAWHGRTHSPEEYRRFAEHRFAAKYKRAKCC